MTLRRESIMFRAFVISFIFLATPALADPFTFYGRINVTAQISDQGEGSFTEINSNSSRVGVQGDYQANEHVNLFYLLEWEINPNSSDDRFDINGRDQYIGISGNFGTFKLGQNDSSLKIAQGKVDYFSDFEADLKTLWRGENRVEDSLVYVTPAWNNFSVTVTHAEGAGKNGKYGQSYAIVYEQPDDQEQHVYASYAIDHKLKGFNTQRVFIQYRHYDWKFSAGAHEQESIETFIKDRGWLVNTAYVLDLFTFKIQHQTLAENEAYSAGIDYRINKSTKIFSWYSDFDFDLKSDSDFLAIGFEHRF